MAARHFRQLFVWQVSEQFKDAVRLLLTQCPTQVDWRFRSQLLSAVESVGANIAEGFARCSAAEFIRFLDYAIASLLEAEQRLVDGTRRGYYDQEQCVPAIRLLKRCFKGMLRLKRSQQRYLSARRAQRGRQA